MADVMTPAQRSHCMSRIRARDTQPEVVIRKMLWSLGCRYRINSSLPGKPDIVFTRQRLAVFIDGCFWHRCPLHYQAPATNPGFWETKIAGNVRRDRDVDARLGKTGWSTLRFWEHEVKNDPEQVLRGILDRLRTIQPVQKAGA
jgi:DNA mismatch endonuclease (patch repair protein)